jgi:hypothetical protein
MSNLDKHRTVLLTGILQTQTIAPMGFKISGSIQIGGGEVTPEGRTVLGRYRATPGVPVNVNLVPIYDVQFRETGIVDGRSVIEVFKTIDDYLVDPVLTRLGLYP